MVEPLGAPLCGWDSGFSENYTNILVRHRMDKHSSLLIKNVIDGELLRYLPYRVKNFYSMSVWLNQSQITFICGCQMKEISRFGNFFLQPNTMTLVPVVVAAAAAVIERLALGRIDVEVPVG